MPTLTLRQLFSTGIILTVLGLAARLYFIPLVFALVGNDAINAPVTRWAQIVLAQAVFQLGLALIAFVLVIRVIKSVGLPGITTATGPESDDTLLLPASATHAVTRMFWIGVGLAIFGTIVQGSLATWQYDVSGATDVGAGLARDVLSVIGSPLQEVAVPLGTLLAAGAMVAGTLKRVPEPVHTTQSVH